MSRSRRRKLTPRERRPRAVARALVIDLVAAVEVHVVVEVAEVEAVGVRLVVDAEARLVVEVHLGVEALHGATRADSGNQPRGPAEVLWRGQQPVWAVWASGNQLRKKGLL